MLVKRCCYRRDVIILVNIISDSRDGILHLSSTKVSRAITARARCFRARIGRRRSPRAGPGWTARQAGGRPLNLPRTRPAASLGPLHVTRQCHLSYHIIKHSKHSRSSHLSFMTIFLAIPLEGVTFYCLANKLLFTIILNSYRGAPNVGIADFFW
jgi:hypothetical protein